MIQRIQSIYLLLVVALQIVTLCLPVGMFVTRTEVWSFYNYGLINAEATTTDNSCWGMFALMLLSSIVAFGTIFLYKNRKLQVRLTIFNMLVIIGWYVVFYAFMIGYKEMLDDMLFFNTSLTLALPIVSLILSVMAVRAIRKDEKLVRAADRLR